MRKFIVMCISLGAMFLISASPVRAQTTLYVANNGSDLNICNQVAPCASFQGAISKGNVSQISCLSTGSYGPFVITTSITIDCGTGNIGNVAINNGNAITINTPAGATVILRHLNINGLGVGTGAIGINAANFPSGTLIVEDCMIHRFHAGYGIYFSPQSGRGLLQVSGSQVFDTGLAIGVFPVPGQIASVTLSQVELAGNLTGLMLSGSGVVAGTMRHSIASANQLGVYANASQVYFTVEESSITANLQNGVETNSAGSVVNVGGSTIGGNGTGVQATLGQLISFGNNQFSANGSDGTFTSTKALK